MTRIAFGIEYDGTDFLGWQSQLQGPTLQDTVAAALGFVANSPLTLVCAGRTDTGVHARCQVAHTDNDSQRTERAWVLGANSRLPPSVCVRWAKRVDDGFHARYSAVARSYRYRLINRPVRLAIDARMATWERVPLDVAAMQTACSVLIGPHDFSSFRTTACQAKSPVRTISTLDWQRHGDEVTLHIVGNGFLHHMVRNIVGSALRVGRGDAPAEWIASVLASRDRRCAGPTAPPTGLAFEGPRYPESFGLPAEVTQ
ncbi:MAG: tRNA pseudouridine(38-40) synthase TruA [Lysobacterales bacterium]